MSRYLPPADPMATALFVYVILAAVWIRTLYRVARGR